MNAIASFPNPVPEVLDDGFQFGDECYFASGANHAGEIMGFAMAGHHLGVTVTELNAAAIDALHSLAGGLTKVFVDTGAFSEVEFGAAGPALAKPISAAEWDRRIGIMETIALAQPMAWRRHQLYLVAPDAVAHQDLTLTRLATYAARVRDLMGLGANIIVPVQKGALSMGGFAERAISILGTDSLVWGVPMKKDATALPELAEFGRFLAARAVPCRVHLLGLGARSPRYGAALSALRAACPLAVVFCDSVRITAMVGRTSGPGKGPRKLTAAQDEVRAELPGLDAGGRKRAALVRVLSRESAETIAAAGWQDLC